MSKGIFMFASFYYIMFNNCTGEMSGIKERITIIIIAV